MFSGRKNKARMLKEQRLISRVRWKKPDPFKARYSSECLEKMWKTEGAS